MRVASVVALSVFASLLAGCEDGPNQTYSPVAPGAAFNSGTGSTHDPVTATTNATFGGRSRNEICDGPAKVKRWAAMLAEPVTPPRKFAGLDMAKDDSWIGLTVEDAELLNCQADSGGDGVSFWGDNGEVEFDYDLGTHIVNFMALNRGYTGMVSGPTTPGIFKSRTGGKFGDNHVYTMQIGQQTTKDGKPFQIDWNDPTKINGEITELQDALLYSLNPLGAPDDVDCVTSGGCLLSIAGNGGHPVWGVRAINFYWQAASATAPPPVPSKLETIYTFYVKTEPYSNNPMELKIDAAGPTAGGNVGPRDPTTGIRTLPFCDIRMGMLWSEFLTNCINVSGNPVDDKTNLNKMFGGRTHSLEDFAFNIVGVNQNFTKVQGPFDIIHDLDVPTDADIASDFYVDVRAKGQIANDVNDGIQWANIKNPDGTLKYPVKKFPLDLHGTGAYYAEFARLVQDDINAQLAAAAKPGGHALGDPACSGATPAAGCTGMEFLMYPGLAPAGTPPALAQLYAGMPKAGYAAALSTYDRSYLKPGDPKIMFLPNFPDTAEAAVGSPFDTTFAQVTRTLGGGDLFALPPDVRDRRYFFRFWAIALVKYLKAYGVSLTLPVGNPGIGHPTPAQVHATTYDSQALFFDSIPGQDKIEYVERAFMGTTHKPLDFEYGTDVLTSNQKFTNFYLKLEREEAAMYAVMATNKAADLGAQNNLQVTNLFGSPVLANYGFSSYACAVTTAPPPFPAGPCTTDASCGPAPYGFVCKDPNAVGAPPPLKPKFCTDPVCGGVYAPTDTAGANLLDGNGQPILTAYPGAFSTTPFTIGASPLKLLDIRLFDLAAKVELPNQADPYDNTSTATPYQVLVPWTGVRPGIGFPIPISGTRDRWISTDQLDFSGITTTILVDYLTAPNADGSECHPTAAKPCSVKILAAETQDFLGDVFMCAAPNGDLLNVGMYTSAGYILDWLKNHPGVSDPANCSIITRYSPFNNYPDFITSLTNGVKVNISQGSGFGRVIDVTLYDPTL